jgi:hypothetical protein
MSDRVSAADEVELIRKTLDGAGVPEVVWGGYRLSTAARVALACGRFVHSDVELEFPPERRRMG